MNQSQKSRRTSNVRTPAGSIVLVFFHLDWKHDQIQAVSSDMTSVEDQLRDFRAFARVHSPAIDAKLASGRCIFSHVSESLTNDPEDHIALANIHEIVCLRPLKNRRSSDPSDIHILSVWFTATSAIAFCSISWPDGLIFQFATTFQRNDDGSFDFVQSFPYESALDRNC
jgi:hypothetical protein